MLPVFWRTFDRSSCGDIKSLNCSKKTILNDFYLWNCRKHSPFAAIFCPRSFLPLSCTPTRQFSIYLYFPCLRHSIQVGWVFCFWWGNLWLVFFFCCWQVMLIVPRLSWIYFCPPSFLKREKISNNTNHIYGLHFSFLNLLFLLLQRFNLL